MENLKKWLSMALTLIMLVTMFVAFAGRASAQTDSGKIILWSWPNQGTLDVFTEVAAPLIKEKTGKDLEIVLKPYENWSTYLNNVIAAIASGETPDIIASAIEGHEFFLSKDLMEPLDGYIANDPEGQEMAKSLSQLAYQAFNTNGVQYQIPFSLEEMVIWYNLAAFREAGIDPIDPVKGWTWDEFLAIAQKLTKEVDGGTRYGAGLYFGGAFMDMPWYYTNGAAILSDDFTQSLTNTPEFAQSLTFINDLVNKYKVCPTPDASVSGDMMVEMFKAGRVAMTNTGGWAVAGMRRDMEGNYGVAPWPKPAGGADNPSTVFGMCSFAIYKDSQNKQDAWEAIKILSSQLISEQQWVRGGQSPVVTAVMESDIALQNYPVGLETWSVIGQNMKVMPCPSIFPEVEKIYTRNLLDMFSGQISPEVAASNMHNEITESLS